MPGHLVRASLLAVLLVPDGAAQERRFVLYELGGMYRATAGHGSFPSHSAGVSGSFVGVDGWYPYAGVGATKDSTYDWLLAPTFGMEKAVPGVGRPRIGYRLSAGSLSGSPDVEAAHTVELGLARRLGGATWGDACYRLTRGSLFSDTPERATFHQAAVSIGWKPDRTRLAFSLGGAATVGGGRREFSQTLGASLPLGSRLSATGSLTFGSSDGLQGGAGLNFAFDGAPSGAGLANSHSELWNDLRPDRPAAGAPSEASTGVEPGGGGGRGGRRHRGDDDDDDDDDDEDWKKGEDDD